MRLAWTALLVLLACGGSGRVGEDLDVDRRRPAPRAADCRRNCQSVDWVEREARAALADIAVCLDEPAYAPADLRGAITIAFRDVPCRQAVAQVAAAAGLRMVVSSVDGRPVVFLRARDRAGEQLVLLPRGDGWRPGGSGAGPGGAAVTPANRNCFDGCAAEVRSCKESCDWSASTCIRGCEDRYRHCSSAC